MHASTPTPPSLLIHNAATVLSGCRGESARLGAVDIRIRDGIIQEIAPGLTPLPGEQTLDARGGVVYPGWINTHHHLFQNLLKAAPEGMNDDLQGWLAKVPYPRLARFTPELLRTAARLGMAELLLSGTTTCADHHYLYHAQGGTDSGDMLFDVAAEFGMRFVLCRGGAIQSASAHPGFSQTALQPETFEAMVADIERLKNKYHQTGPRPMRRLVVAPTTPTFSLPPLLLRELGDVARRLGLRMHTHLSETDNYVKFCRERYNCLPVEFVGESDWLGPDVWFAHMVHMKPSEIHMMASTGTGVSHCPVSNARLGSGVAPIPQMAAAGVPISLGVDGVASNESGSMINEAHMAWLIHRATQGASATTIDQVVHWGTAGGARVLGLESVGRIAVGEAADLVIYDMNHLRYQGFHDLGAAPVAAGEPVRILASLVAGRVVVENGEIPGLDIEALRREAAQALQALRSEQAETASA